jgi:hypothetical protein
MKRAASASCLFALLLAGCGSVDRGTSERDGGREKRNAPLRFTKAEAKATARSMLVQESELPSGWAQEKAIRSGGGGSCDRLPGANIPTIAEAISPLFVNGDAEASITSSAAVFSTQKRARRAYQLLVRAIRSEAGERCFARSFRAGGGSVGALAPLRYRVGQRSAGFRAKFHIHTVCGCTRGYFSFVLIQERQAAAWIIFVRGSTRPLQYEREIARRVAKRMRLAQEARDAGV